MTPEDLASAGRALYGDRWQTSLAHDLHVSDRTVRRWLTGAVAELRSVLRERMKTFSGVVPFTVNPTTRTILHNATNAMFRYEDDGTTLTLLHPGFAAPDQVALLFEGAKETLRQEKERDPKVNSGADWRDQNGRPADGDQFYGFLRGSVIIPEGFDLTEPVFDETFDAEEGILHR
jgi:hypothetical protein